MIDHRERADPMTLKYMQYLRRMLRLAAAWPGYAVDGKPRRPPYVPLYLMFEEVVLITGQLIFIFDQFQTLSFFVLGHVYITLSLSVVMFFRAGLLCFERYGSIFRDFVRKFHLMHFKHKGEYWEKMYQMTNQVSLYLTWFMIVLSMSGVVSFNLVPLYNNYQNGVFRQEPPENITVEFSIHYQFQGFKQDNNYVFTSVANLLFSCLAAFIICAMDLALCLMVIQIVGHINIFVHMLRSLPKPQVANKRQGFWIDNRRVIIESVNHFDEQENEVIWKLITESVQHHLLIVNFTENISSFFGPMLAINYLYHMVSVSLLLVECMQGQEALFHYGPLTLMTIGQLAQLSVTFEIVGSESEKLKDEVYYVPWEAMSVRNQRAVGFLLKRVQTPIRVSAMGMTDVGVQTMAKILKTTLSYCAFLNTLNS